MEDRHLYLLWTNGDPLTAEHMVMMYATNAKLNRWWDQVTVIVWGAPSKLLAESQQLQMRLKLAQQAGVEFTACIACAERLGVCEKLLELGVAVIPWGPPLTELLQNNANLLTV